MLRSNNLNKIFGKFAILSEKILGKCWLIFSKVSGEFGIHMKMFGKDMKKF